nr:uncharacterized protein LOC107448979 [Parasteatoda tepidariorum]
MQNQTADTVAEAFFAGWIARFGVPETVPTDQGRQFESELFSSLTKFLGTQKTRTVAYNPKCNGASERFHRILENAIKCDLTERWMEVLPTVLLGIHSSLKEDIDCTPVEMVYGCSIRLPGEFFHNSFSKPATSHSDFSQKLLEKLRDLRPVPLNTRGVTRPIFISKDLQTCSQVFVRIDSVRRPLEQPYKGPFKAISRTNKFFVLDLEGQKSSVSIDRLKPAYFLSDEVADSTNQSLMVKTEVTTRSGRKVRFVLPFQA